MSPKKQKTKKSSRILNTCSGFDEVFCFFRFFIFFQIFQTFYVDCDNDGHHYGDYDDNDDVNYSLIQCSAAKFIFIFSESFHNPY